MASEFACFPTKIQHKLMKSFKGNTVSNMPKWNLYLAPLKQQHASE